MRRYFSEYGSRWELFPFSWVCFRHFFIIRAHLTIMHSILQWYHCIDRGDDLWRADLYLLSVLSLWLFSSWKTITSCLLLAAWCLVVVMLANHLLRPISRARTVLGERVNPRWVWNLSDSSLSISSHSQKFLVQKSACGADPGVDLRVVKSKLSSRTSILVLWIQFRKFATRSNGCDETRQTRHIDPAHSIPNEVSSLVPFQFVGLNLMLTAHALYMLQWWWSNAMLESSLIQGSGSYSKICACGAVNSDYYFRSFSFPPIAISCLGNK